MKFILQTGNTNIYIQEAFLCNLYTHLFSPFHLETEKYTLFKPLRY